MKICKLEVWLAKDQHKWLLDTARRTQLTSRTLLECAIDILREKGGDYFIKNWVNARDEKADHDRKVETEKRLFPEQMATKKQKPKGRKKR